MKSSLDTDYSTVVKLFGFLSLLACFLLAFQAPSSACSPPRPNDDVSDLPKCSDEERIRCSENRQWCLKSKICVIKAKSRNPFSGTQRITQTFESLYYLDSGWALFPRYTPYRFVKWFDSGDVGWTDSWLSNDGWLARLTHAHQLDIFDSEGQPRAKIRASDFADPAVASMLEFTYCWAEPWLVKSNFKDEVYFWGPWVIVRVKEIESDFFSDFLYTCYSYREIVISRQTGQVIVNWQQARTQNICANPLILSDILVSHSAWLPKPVVNQLYVTPYLFQTAKLTWHHFFTGHSLFQDSL